jgi:hypothetical protein
MERSFKKIAGSALGAVCAVALTIPAGSPAVADPAADPDVARISAVAGNVDVRRADSNQSFAAVPNAPVGVGDYIETQDGSRSEVQFDGAVVLRLAPQTQLRFTHLTPDDHELQLAQGTVELRVFRGVDGRPAIETPSAQIRPDEAGRYRVTVDGNGNTLVTVRSGRADVTVQGSSGPQTLTASQAVEIAASGNPPQVQGIGPVAYDAFDGWADARDTGWAHVQNWNYVDSGIVGANDLSDYGQWTSDPNYGQVWVPTDEPATWSPYSDGRWVWEPDYGWTWIGDEPWGYAPYHYGRWFHGERGWCWTPRGYGPTPYAYAPAVVGFFGLGAGIGISFTIGEVGWVPLAPGEAYNPWWNGDDGRGYGWNGYGSGPSARYYDRGNLARSYRNARYPGAALAVSGGDFARGNFAHVMRVRPNQYAQAASFRGVVPVVPTARNLAFSGRAIAPARAQGISPRFRRMAAPAVSKFAFAKQRSNVAAIARKQYPIARGVGFTGSRVARASASKPNAARANVARPGIAKTNAARPGIARSNVARAKVATHARPASVWDRFAAKGKKPAANSRIAANHSRENVATAHGASSGAPGHSAAASHVARNGTAQKTAGRPASKVAGRPAPKRAAYVAPHSADTHRSAGAPVKHAYVSPVSRAHAAPVAHAYVPPVKHTYVAPVQHTYAAPARHTYVTPPVTHHYAAPAARTYAAPRAPVVHAAPAPHPAAPAPHAAPAAAPPHEDRGHR